jgi:hypothetical protein
MPTQQALRPNEAEVASRRRLERAHQATIRACHAVRRAEQESDQFRARLDELDGNPPLVATAAAAPRVMALVFPLLLLGAAFGEWVISVPTAEWLTLAVLGRPEWLPWTRVALPLGIIAADLLAAYLRVRAVEDAEVGAGSPAARLVGWLLLGAMTGLSLATQLALRPAADAPAQLTQTFWLRTACLVGITAALHALLIFSGELLVSSLVYWQFLLRRHRVASRLAVAEEDRERYSREAVGTFNSYVQNRAEHVQRFGDPGADAFDVMTRRVLTALLGYDPFRGGPEAAPPAPPAPGGETPSSRPGAAFWDVETEVTN